jgi:hypothetical protein
MLEKDQWMAWMLKSFIWEDSETGQLLGYNHHFQRRSSSDFMEFIRLDLHKKGDPSEDSPHVHMRLEARETPGRLSEDIQGASTTGA